jgi:hypothetical protein
MAIAAVMITPATTAMLEPAMWMRQGVVLFVKPRDITVWNLVLKTPSNS